MLVVYNQYEVVIFELSVSFSRKRRFQSDLESICSLDIQNIILAIIKPLLVITVDSRNHLLHEIKVAPQW